MNSTSIPPSPGVPSRLDAALKVLVVDDDGSNRLLTVRWLERVGIMTCQAVNGEEALRVLRHAPESIGAVVLDLMMPTMSGYELLERVRSDDALRDVPVVILTAHAQQERDVVYGLKNGAVDHLAKPFRGPILAAKVQSLVERRGRHLHLEERLRRAEALATGEPATGLGNRQQFERELEREASFTTRHRAPLSLIIVRVDNVGLIRDALGQSSADHVIAWSAHGLERALRTSDRGFRTGEDAFAVLLRGLDHQSGLRAARRLVKFQERQPSELDERGAFTVTVRAGVAAADSSNDYDVSELFKRADEALHAGEERTEGEPS